MDISMYFYAVIHHFFSYNILFTTFSRYLISDVMFSRIFVFFFFSSRRRHTRCSRDWSSDVCSSDLCGERPCLPPPANVAGFAAVPRPHPPAGVSPRRGCGLGRRRSLRGTVRRGGGIWLGRAGGDGEGKARGCHGSRRHSRDHPAWSDGPAGAARRRVGPGGCDRLTPREPGRGSRHGAEGAARRGGALHPRETVVSRPCTCHRRAGTVRPPGVNPAQVASPPDEVAPLGNSPHSRAPRGFLAGARRHTVGAPFTARATSRCGFGRRRSTRGGRCRSPPAARCSPSRCS